MTKPREDEEKVDGQIAVVDPLVEMAGRIGFEQMEPDDHDRRYAAQSVEDVVVGFGSANAADEIF